MLDIIHKLSLAVHCILAILLFIAIVVNAVSINKAYASINTSVEKLNQNSVNILTTVNDNVKKLTDNSLNMLNAVNGNLKILTDNSVSILNADKSNMSNLNTIKNVLSPDLSLPLTEDCINSEYCSISYLKNKFLKLNVTNANQITNKGSMTSQSVITTNRIYFSDGNWYNPFYMPYGIENDLLFVHIDSSWSVTINKAFTNMPTDINVSTNKVAAFMYKNNTWKFLTIVSANKLMT